MTWSARGVTAESIKIGVPVVDTTSIGRNPVHDPVRIWEAAAQRVNDDGGVLGRMIDLVAITYDPVDSTSQDATCTELTQDEGVFLAMGVMIREAALCYTELNDTAAINTFLSDDDIYERSLAPFITVTTKSERALENQVNILVDSGILDGRGVALSTGSGETGLAQAETLRDLLTAGGVDVVEITQWQSPSSDQFAIDAEMDVNVELWRTAGADTVVAVPGASVPTAGALSRNGWDGDFVILDDSGTDVGLIEGLGYSADSLVDAYAVIPPSEADLYEAGEAGVVECADYIDAFYDDDDPIEIRTDDINQNGLVISVRACQALDLFVEVATLAGADLTYDSFEAAADELGSSTAVTGVIEGSLGPGKRDFTDAGDALFFFDEGLERFVLA